jgi:8-oxo-dGTP pyrophosphatase MutT (NUDIX family)
MTQYGALPVAVDQDGIRVMLITSRETRRWIIPKGWPHKRLSPRAVAALEAYEEAGLQGRVAEQPTAVFSYVKRLKSGKSVTCQVETYLFHVEQELDDWPEKLERERRWMTPDEAARLVSDVGLVEVLKDLQRQGAGT